MNDRNDKTFNNFKVKSDIEREYTPVLLEALDNIDQDFYHITTTYGEVIRERVFCYEFYHHMRKIHKKLKLAQLLPEIDKRGNENFTEKDMKNPDFIFHKPGEMAVNQVVIEVKVRIITRFTIKEYLRTLKL